MNNDTYRKLEVGSGNFPKEGYEHLDIQDKFPHLEYIAPMHDIPVEDNTFDELCSVHVFEHQVWNLVVPTLKEWLRVLKPGGKMEIYTPNLRWIAKSYLESRTGYSTELFRDLEVFNDQQKGMVSIEDNIVDAGMWACFKLFSPGGFHNHHYLCYDATMLDMLLKKAGYVNFKVLFDMDYLGVEAYKPIDD